MAIISWGKPKIEIVKWGASDTSCPETGWDTVYNPKEDTTDLSTTKGDIKEATGEGGERIDVIYKRSKFALSFELYVQKGQTLPIGDDQVDDGVVQGTYGVRLTPEDTTLEGFIMPKCAVTVETLYSAADGKRVRYTFDGLRPATGKTLQPYTASGSGSGSGSGSTSG